MFGQWHVSACQSTIRESQPAVGFLPPSTSKHGSKNTGMPLFCRAGSHGISLAFIFMTLALSYRHCSKYLFLVFVFSVEKAHEEAAAMCLRETEKIIFFLLQEDQKACFLPNSSLVCPMPSGRHENTRQAQACSEGILRLSLSSLAGLRGRWSPPVAPPGWAMMPHCTGEKAAFS